MSRLRVAAGVISIAMTLMATTPGIAAKLDDETFREMASTLISGIDQAWRPSSSTRNDSQTMAYLRKAYNYIQAKRVRIALWPFDPDEIPLAKEAAEDFNDVLFAALIKQAGGRYDFVARDEIKALVDDMEQTGALDDAANNPLAALMENVRKVDILVRGRIRLRGDETVLSYRAVSVDGRIMAGTKPYIVRLGPVERNSVSLDRAVRAAARQLVNGAHDMTELRLGGIRYQDTGSQPAFGRRFLELVSSEIAKSANNALSGRTLKIKSLQAVLKRGMAVTGKQLADYQLDAKPGSYMLSGTYWVLDEKIEMRINLQDAEGATIPWVGRISRKDIGGTAIRPKHDLGTLRDDDGGPVAFHLKSDRGSDPAYKIGEKMNLLIRLGRDAWSIVFIAKPTARSSKSCPIRIFGNT